MIGWEDPLQSDLQCVDQDIAPYSTVFIYLMVFFLLQHTNVLVFLLIERLFIYHKYPNRFSGLSALLGFAIVYQLWLVLWCPDSVNNGNAVCFQNTMNTP